LKRPRTDRRRVRLAGNVVSAAKRLRRSSRCAGNVGRRAIRWMDERSDITERGLIGRGFRRLGA
jgi:hypothetical protein